MDNRLNTPPAAPLCVRQERSDFLTMNCAGGGINMVGVSSVKGGCFDLSFAGGWVGRRGWAGLSVVLRTAGGTSAMPKEAAASILPPQESRTLAVASPGLPFPASLQAAAFRWMRHTMLQRTAVLRPPRSLAALSTRLQRCRSGGSTAAGWEAVQVVLEARCSRCP